MKVKTTHVIGALLVMGIIVTGYYYFTQVQQVPQGQVTKFEQYAEDLGLDLQQFSSCLDSGKFKDEVQSDFNDGRLYGVDGTPTFFVNSRIVVGAVSLDELKQVVDQELANPTKNIEIKTGSNPLRGSPSANLTIVEFSDFQCPYCARAETTMSQLLQQYPGKIKVYYRDFPLSFHAFSEQAAEASRCAGEQDKYWEYHDMLFEKQSEWSSG